jgi:hypothetical protein
MRMMPLIEPRRVQQHMESPQRSLGLIGPQRRQFQRPAGSRSAATLSLLVRNGRDDGDRIVIPTFTKPPNLRNAIRQFTLSKTRWHRHSCLCSSRIALTTLVAATLRRHLTSRASTATLDAPCLHSCRGDFTSPSCFSWSPPIAPTPDTRSTRSDPRSWHQRFN